MTEPAAARPAGLDQPAGDEPCLDVSASEWRRRRPRAGVPGLHVLRLADAPSTRPTTRARPARGSTSCSRARRLHARCPARASCCGPAYPTAPPLAQPHRTVRGSRLARARDARDVRDRLRRVRRRDRPGLRPLLLPEGFEGTPLRKSFMLAARASQAVAGRQGTGRGPRRGRSRPAGAGSRRPGVPPPEWGPR